MASQHDIEQIFSELSNRCDRISVSTIKDVLIGKVKVIRGTRNFIGDKGRMPTLGETVTAFLRYTCVIFTAFRGGYTFEENMARNKRLKADMDELGLKYCPVIGCYREAEWEHPNVENCYFVYNEKQQNNLDFFTKAYRLSEKYDQDSFLYKRAGINRTAFLVASTAAGKSDLEGDIRFAGQLFTHVLAENAWTDCSDGRFAFQQKGVIMTATSNRKIKIGEGNLFDTESYKSDGLLVLRHTEQIDLGMSCKKYGGAVPLVQHVFKADNPSTDYLHDVVFRSLKKLRDQGCRKIGIHCSVTINDSSVEGAEIAYDIIKSWANRYDKKFGWIVIVDIYGDYAKVLNKSIKQ